MCKKRVLIFCAMSILLFNGCATSSTDDSFKKRYANDKDSVDNRILDMQERLKKEPNNPDYLFNLGAGYYECQLYEEAIVPLEKAKALQPKAADIRLALGGVYFGLDKYSEAKKEFEEAVALDPRNAEGYVGLTKVYRRTGDKDKYTEQLEIIKRIIAKRAETLAEALERENEVEKKPNLALSEEYNDKAIKLIEAGEYLKATDEGKKAIEYNPHNASAYYNIGLALRRLGMYHKALAFYKKAISIDPTFVNPYVNIGYIYKGIGKEEEAIAIWQKAISIDPNIPEIYANLGATYKEMGRITEARENLDKALGLYSKQENTKEADKIAALLKELK